MYTVVYALKKHTTLRIFLTVALSLAMAWAVGSGIHLNSSPTVSTPATVAPANNAATDNNARLNPAAYTAPDSGDQVTALDAALKNMSSLQRDRNSANTDPVTNSASPQTGVAQEGNALQNKANVGPNK